MASFFSFKDRIGADGILREAIKRRPPGWRHSECLSIPSAGRPGGVLDSTLNVS